MLVALNSIASDQACPTKDTIKKITQLLNYAATHPNPTVCFKASDMVPHIDSDASYLSKSKSCSCITSYHYLSSMPANTKKAAPNLPLNGAINVFSNILEQVIFSAAEANLGGLF